MSVSASPSPLVFEDPALTDRTRELLSSLPEFGQQEFFDAGIREALVEGLDLREAAWDVFFSSVYRRLANDGFAHIQDLPFDENNRLSVALASVIGNPVPHNSRVPTLVRKIRPRPGPDPLENRPHTDSPHWIEPNELITLQCEEEDQHVDVWSHLANIREVEAQLAASDEALYRRLFEDRYPFILIPEQGDAGYQYQPVLTRHFEGGEELSHVRFCLTDSLACVKDYDLDPACVEDLRIVEQVAADAGQWNRFVLRQGDWLIFDNKRIFHSKTRTSPDSVRVLRKMKLTMNRERMYEIEEVIH